MDDDDDDGVEEATSSIKKRLVLNRTEQAQVEESNSSFVNKEEESSDDDHQSGDRKHEEVSSATEQEQEQRRGDGNSVESDEVQIIEKGKCGDEEEFGSEGGSSDEDGDDESSSESSYSDSASASASASASNEEAPVQNREAATPHKITMGVPRQKLWGKLWSILKIRGWNWAAGSGLVEFIYLAPNTTKSTGVLGKTMFTTTDDVIEFFEENENFLLQTIVREIVPPSTAKKSEKKSSKKRKSKVDPSTIEANDIYNFGWQTMLGEGWSYARGSGLVDWLYLKPGVTLKTGVLNKTMFDTIEAMVDAWIYDEKACNVVKEALRKRGVSFTDYKNFRSQNGNKGTPEGSNKRKRLSSKKRISFSEPLTTTKQKRKRENVSINSSAKKKQKTETVEIATTTATPGVSPTSTSMMAPASKERVEPRTTSTTDIFRGMFFEITEFQLDVGTMGAPSQKELCTLIERQSGTVISNPLPNVVVYTISNTTSYHTTKFLQCIARGIPCLHFSWILESVKAGKLLPWNNYILPAGLSLKNIFVFPVSWDKYLNVPHSGCIPEFPKPTPMPRRVLHGYKCALVLPNENVVKQVKSLIFEAGAELVPVDAADEKTAVICDSNDDSEETLAACTEAFKRGASVVPLEWITLCIVENEAIEPSRRHSKLQCCFANPNWSKKTDDKKNSSSSNEVATWSHPPASPGSSANTTEPPSITWIGPPKVSVSDGRKRFFACLLPNNIRIDEGDFVRITTSHVSFIQERGLDSNHTSIVFPLSSEFPDSSGGSKEATSTMVRFGKVKGLWESSEGAKRVNLEEYICGGNDNSAQTKLIPTGCDFDCPLNIMHSKFIFIRSHEVRNLAYCSKHIDWRQRVFVV